MTKFLSIVSLIFIAMGLFNIWGLLLRPTGLDPISIGWVDYISLWGGIALLCVAAFMAVMARRKARYGSDD